MKKVIMFIMAISLLLSCFSVSYAEDVNTVINENAVYINGDFYGHNSMTVEGSIYTANGDVLFDSSFDNIVKGNISLSSAKSYTVKEGWDKPYIHGNINKLENTSFNYEEKYFPDYPVISNVIEDSTAQSPLIVKEDTYFKKLNIKSYMQIDTSKGDVSIVADKFSISNDGYIEIIGGGKVNLYLNSSMNLSFASTVINKNGDSDKMNIFIKGSVNLGGNANVNANIYTKNDVVKITGSGVVTGNIYSSSKKFNYNSGATLYGTIYAPLSDVVVATRCIIRGGLIANSLEMYKNSQIIYDEKYSLIINDTTIPEGDEVMIRYPYAYLYGYGDNVGNVGAEDNIKRCEATTLLYRLLKQDNKLGSFVPGTTSFDDVSDNDWFKNSLMYMKHIGAYAGNLAMPYESITRGEIAKIICYSLKIRPVDNVPLDFKDLASDNTNYLYIKALVDKGIMEGYDGNIHPDANITRAEYVTMINRLIGRDNSYKFDNYKKIYNDHYSETVINPETGETKVIHKQHAYGHFICTNDTIYPDLNDENYWAYAEIMRASLGFTDEKIEGFHSVDPERKQDRNTIDYN